MIIEIVYFEPKEKEQEKDIMGRRKIEDDPMQRLFVTEYDDPYRRLADAVVLRVCENYKKSLTKLWKYCKNLDITYKEAAALTTNDETLAEAGKRYSKIIRAIQLRNECESFFKGDTTYIRVDDSGERMMKDIRKLVQKSIDDGTL